MAKTGRNQPCRCGSGKKYKHCCLAKDDEARHAAYAAPATDERHDRLHHMFCPNCYAKLATDSNAVVGLVDAGRFHEAERAARQLLKDFPGAYDGYARLGLVFETRGDDAQAADCYRKVIDMARLDPDLYPSGFVAGYQARIDQLGLKVSRSS
jgi:tetratricopeptide (TPR) repeat protein